jgi:hypothetical protein
MTMTIGAFLKVMWLDGSLVTQFLTEVKLMSSFTGYFLKFQTFHERYFSNVDFLIISSYKYNNQQHKVNRR